MQRLLHALPVVVALVALPMAFAVARDGGSSVPASGAAAPGVSDDDGGDPMFALTALSPGRAVTRCIRVRFGGAAAGLVRLAGRVDGALADRIALRVQRGRGGGFDGCEGFRGVEVFEGTLAEFADTRGEEWRAAEG
nr:hypothetical protein [Actinomycetota bacterium]